MLIFWLWLRFCHQRLLASLNSMSIMIGIASDVMSEAVELYTATVWNHSIFLSLQASQAPLTFGHALLNSCHFLTSDWSSIFYTCRETMDWIEFKLGEWIHYGTPQAWLIFNNAPLNSHCFQATVFWSNCLHTFTDKNADQIELKFGGWTHYGTPPGGLMGPTRTD